MCYQILFCVIGFNNQQTHNFILLYKYLKLREMWALLKKFAHLTDSTEICAEKQVCEVLLKSIESLVLSQLWSKICMNNILCYPNGRGYRLLIQPKKFVMR